MTNEEVKLLSELTLELVESRLKEIAQRHKIDLMDESVLYLYSKEYGSLTNDIADILCPRYGFKGIYPTPKSEIHIESSNTWTALRKQLKERGITEQQYYDWLVKNTTPPIVDEVLRLIVNHVYHSDEERLIAPPILLIDENGNYPYLNQK